MVGFVSNRDRHNLHSSTVGASFASGIKVRPLQLLYIQIASPLLATPPENRPKPVTTHDVLGPAEDFLARPLPALRLKTQRVCVFLVEVCPVCLDTLKIHRPRVYEPLQFHPSPCGTIPKKQPTSETGQPPRPR